MFKQIDFFDIAKYVLFFVGGTLLVFFILTSIPKISSVEAVPAVVSEVVKDDFFLVSESGDFKIFCHRHTDILYLCYKKFDSGGLTVMLDADGNPLLYSEYSKKLEIYE